MDISCAFAPGPDTVEHTVLAEQLGYRRAWFYDSPALYGDVWVTIARAAERTSRIGLGTAVLIPNLRHPMTQAAAIATIEQIAPGRLAVGLGTGFTGRLAMGQKPLTWAYMRRYLRQLRSLLAGETVTIEGTQAKMIHPDGYAPPRPLRTPVLVGANGPKGLEVARELGDGIVCVLGPQPGFDWCAVLVFGTVLDEGEDATSQRIVDAAGPGLAALYHSQLAAALPRGGEYIEMLHQLPAETRHLTMHERHFVAVNERDRPFLTPEVVAQSSVTGTADEVRARLDLMAQGGATEVMYHAAGPDIARELRAFAAAAGC
jgi:5,10-methylenetetrahydromethanopterin reductase